MLGIVKFTARTLVIGALVVGGIGLVTAAVAGPERTQALAAKLQSNVVESIDRRIDDPTALRAQLRELEKEYPKRVNALRGDLAELREQMRQLEVERSVAMRVVELAEADLGRLENDVAMKLAASSDMHRTASDGRFDQHGTALRQARTRLEQVKQTRFVYGERAADAQRDLGYLAQQAERLEEAVMQLETERAQFRAQLWQIERQVDAIARNERLIDMMKDRQKTLDQVGRFEAQSLDHLTGRLSQVRSRQEAELEVLGNEQRSVNYEDQARFEVQVRGELDLNARDLDLGDDLITLPLAPHSGLTPSRR
jgi:DNA repair exonuclease SbcCD ATPase subunit